MTVLIFANRSRLLNNFEDKYPDGALRADTPEAIAMARDIERIVDLRIASPSRALRSRGEITYRSSAESGESR